MLTSNEVGLVDITAIPNADVAVTIATSIAKSAHLIASSDEISVFFDEKSKIWFRCQNSKYPFTFCMNMV